MKSLGSSANTTRNPSSRDRAQVKFKKANFFFLALIASGGVVAAWFGAANITPYKALLQGSADELAKNGFIQGIYWIPIIGGIARSLASNVVWLAATIFWGFIQIVEILPGVLWRHQGFLSAVVRSHDGLGTVAVRDNDPKSIKSAKNALNKLVSGFLDHMFLYCIGAYLVDAAICC